MCNVYYRNVFYTAPVNVLKTEIEKELEDVQEDVQKPFGNK